MGNVAKDFAQLISQSKSNKTGPYDTQATVKRVEGNTAWVSIPGGVDETPIDKTVNCAAGDKVQVRVSGGRAWITGNASAPPTDDKKANEAKATADTAQIVAVDAKETADAVEGIAQAAQASATTAANAAASAVLAAGNAQTAANSAQSSADNASEYAARALGNLSTVQSVAETLTWIAQHGTMALTADVTPDPTHVYFVVDAAGDYTVGGVTYAIVTEPVTADMGTYYELSIDESLNNYVGTHLALDGEGLWLLPASSGTNKVLIATGAGSTYTTAGTYLIDAAGEVIGKFTANSVQIGKNGEAQAEVTQYAFSATDKEGDAFFIAEDLRNEAGGVHTVTDTFISDGVTTNISLTYRATNTTYTVTVDGGNPPASMTKTQTQIVFGAVPQAGAVIVATYKTASQYAKAYTLGIRADNSVKGGMSVAEGEDCIASGRYSHAEGHGCTSAGAASHTEGISAQALYNACHAEGANTQANDHGSHAEGLNTKALGYASHSQNYYTKAEYAYQTAIGKYNYPSSNDAFEVGNGTDDNSRSNAFTVKWNGDVKSSGDVEDGNGNVLADKADTSAVPTKTSDLTNDSGFITTETDPTVPSWAKASTKPTYTASEVGALPDTTAIPTNTSDLNNDSGFVSGTGFYQIVQLAVTTSSSISAHGSYANATYTVPSAARPSGMTLVGIVGWGASNYRLSPSTAFVNGTHSISVTLANTSASSVSSGATVNFRLLYIKATSA